MSSGGCSVVLLESLQARAFERLETVTYLECAFVQVQVMPHWILGGFCPYMALGASGLALCFSMLHGERFSLACASGFRKAEGLYARCKRARA